MRAAVGALQALRGLQFTMAITTAVAESSVT